MELYEGILQRRSIRRFKEDKLSADMIKKLLHAGMSAPSAKNGQPYEFIAIENKETLLKLCDDIPTWAPLKTAALCIEVVANLNVGNDASEELYMLDCSAAAQNIQLAAVSMGLGCVWLGTYKRAKQEGRVKEVLELPERVLPVVTLAIGYPETPNNSIKPYNEEKMHFEKY